MLPSKTASERRRAASSPYAFASFAWTTGLCKLQSLDLGGCKISDEGVASLTGAASHPWPSSPPSPALHHIHLATSGSPDPLSPSGLASLTELKLDNCHRISDDALKLLSAIRGLRRLNCSYTGVTDAGVAALAALPVLSALSLDSCQARAGNQRGQQPLLSNG